MRRESLVRDDRVLLATRWLSALIVPFLLAAFGVLYLLPEHTGQLFAWNVQPRMTAMMLGEAYLAGASSSYGPSSQPAGTGLQWASSPLPPLLR